MKWSRQLKNQKSLQGGVKSGETAVKESEEIGPKEARLNGVSPQGQGAFGIGKPLSKAEAEAQVNQFIQEAFGGKAPPYTLMEGAETDLRATAKEWRIYWKPGTTAWELQEELYHLLQHTRRGTTPAEAYASGLRMDKAQVLLRKGSDALIKEAKANKEVLQGIADLAKRYDDEVKMKEFLLNHSNWMKSYSAEESAAIEKKTIATAKQL